MDSPDNIDAESGEDSVAEQGEQNTQPMENVSPHEESLLINDCNFKTLQEPTREKTVRIVLPSPSPSSSSQTSQEVEKEECLLTEGVVDDDQDSSEEGDIAAADIDQDIDDALDEGYMGMECTLERGFSLNESAIAHDLRLERYDEVAIKYKESTKFSRYRPELKHLIPVRKPPKEKDEMPLDRTGLYSFVTYSWITGLMWKAYKTGLKEEDVPICSKYDMCNYNTDRLENLWNEELKNKGKDGASFHSVVLRFIRTRLIFGLILFVITLAMGFIGPTFFMRYLITWLSSDEPITTGLVYAVGLTLAEFIRILMFGMVWTINYRTGIRLRSACLGLIYKKLMRMSNLGSKSIGEVSGLNPGQRFGQV